jgi:hypothetical protein
MIYLNTPDCHFESRLSIQGTLITGSYGHGEKSSWHRASRFKPPVEKTGRVFSW